MKTFWKLLGAAALVSGLTPYKVEKDEETGEKSYQALLWRITSKRTEDEDKREIGINLGEGTLTEKLWDMVDKTEEPHLFSDELCVEYTGVPVTAEDADKAVEDVAKDVEEAVDAVAEDVDKAVEEVAEEVEKAVEEAAEAAEPKAE